MGYLAQHILGAANNDYENLMRMVVFVIVGIFWVIGGILKARANKLKDQNEHEIEEPSDKAGLKRPRQGRQPTSIAVKTAYPQRQPAQPSYGKVIPPQAVAKPKTISPKEAVLFRPLSLVESLKMPAEKITSTEPERILQLDLNDPEQIKRAILYYEILGKPLALRGID